MRKLQIITLFFFMTKFVSATGQLFDYVIMNGDTLITYSIILERHPNKNELIDKIYKELYSEDKKVNPQKYLSEETEVLDYSATWTIQNNKLILCNIHSPFDQSVQVDIKKVFEKEMIDSTVVANWITDKISLYKGKILVYGIEPIWDNEIELEITNGCITQTTTFKNYVAKVSKFKADDSFIYSRINWTKLPDLKNSVIQAYIGIKPNKEGLFESFDEGSFVFEDSKIITDKDNFFLKEALRIAKLVPEWNVIYRKNQIVVQQLMIIFNKENQKKYAR